MLWLVYALSSAFLFALTALLSRVVSINSAHPRAYSVIFGFMSGVCALLLFLVEPFSFRAVSMTVIILTICSTLCYSFGDRVLFFVSRSIEASLVTIIDKLTPVVTFVASLIFLGESFTWLKLVAVVLILSGNFLIVIKNTKIKFDLPFFLALFAALAVGIGLTIDKHVSVAYAVPLYAFINFFAPALYNTFLPPIAFSTVVREAKVAWRGILLIAVGNVVSYYFVLKAFSLADASRVVPIMSSSTLIIVLAGVIFLKERSHIGRKVIAGLCVCVGVVLISV